MPNPESAGAPGEASDPQELKMQPRKLQMSAQQKNSPVAAPAAEARMKRNNSFSSPTSIAGSDNGNAAAARPPTRSVTMASDPKKMTAFTRQSSWEQYKAANKSNPLLTKCITTGVLMGAGNVLGQSVLMFKGRQKAFLLKKLVAFVVFGFFFSGPMGHVWLKFLNSRKTVLKGQALILYKIALDRFLYGPAFNLVMMSFVYRVSGQSWPQMVKSLRASFWNAQVLNWKMWPIAQYVNFNYVPAELQLLYMNCIALVWTTSLSLLMS